MNLFVADPEWGWWIVAYFFLGGIAAGCYFIAALLELFGHDEDRPLIRLGYRIAFPLVVVCGLLLVVDLNRPERFWHMLLQSEVVDQAFDKGWPWSATGWGLMVQAPMLKHWSPMSIGAWALFVFGGFSLASCWASLWPAGRVARLLNWRWLRWPWRLAGSGVGFFVASYTGVLLAATNQPIWSQTDWVGPLFLCSAASTALATLVVIGRAEQYRPSHERVKRAELVVLCLELVVFAIFVVSLSPWLKSLTGVPLVWRLMGGALICGILVPLGLRIGWHQTWTRRPVLPAAAVLLGGFLLRCGIVSAAPAMLERQREQIAAADMDEATTPTSWFSISPEDNRERGGGPGASGMNRADPLQPRSKVIHEAP